MQSMGETYLSAAMIAAKLNPLAGTGAGLVTPGLLILMGNALSATHAPTYGKPPTS
jgi:hypothetical protein